MNNLDFKDQDDVQAENRFQEAAKLAAEKSRTVAKRILGAGLYADSDVYIFCQNMYAEIRKIDSNAAEEFKFALAPDIVLVC